MPPFGHYATLGIAPSAGFPEIKKAYYRQVKKCHPDLFGGARDKEEEFKSLVHAFDILSDPDKRKRYDVSSGITLDTTRVHDWGREGYSVMDTEADDILEEIIVGNNPPRDATIGSLFLDLENTEVFMSFREGKNFLRAGNFTSALEFFIRVVLHSPNNILYRYYLARTYCALKKFNDARMHYNMAIELGRKRIPPQRLRRLHEELDAISVQKLTVWKKVAGFLGVETKKRRFIDTEDDMVSQMNRSIARLMRDSRNQKDETKLLK
ncbi:MAG: DnaJ domain-containing protein [Victivallales bacterium]|jgi:tetratricopeptide (TPR) repeat protein